MTIVLYRLQGVVMRIGYYHYEINTSKLMYLTGHMEETV